MSLTEICIRRPVLAWMMMFATILFGLVAFNRIGISQFPDVDFPTITVAVTWEGAAPEIIENDVVEPLEEAVVQVEGIKSLTSTSRQGSASITIELDLKRNVDAALQDVQTKVAQAQRRLPRDIDPPVVSKTNPEDQPILWVGVSGPYPQAVVSDYARYRVKEKLQTVPGVGEINMGGYLERNVRIWLNAEWLDEHKVTAADVVDALQKQHIELPGGFLEAGSREVSVRVLGEAVNLETLRQLVIREVDGAPVYLSQVALVEDGFEDRRRTSRVMGQPAQGLGIKKLRGSNAVEVANQVKAALEELKKDLPKDMQLGINFDSAQFIEESVHEVEFELLLAVLLTALVCWMFLGSLSSTLNVVLAIPMSLFGTVAVIYFLGFTLNTFSLLGLSLAVGIVVDDSIMVMENIFRHAEMGKPKEKAAREGTGEITFAALAATVAVIAIFIPVVFMEGVIGRFFLQFGVTLCLAVMFSYVEAVTLAPARAAQLLNVSREHRGRVGRWVDAAFHALERRYERVLKKGLDHAGWVLASAVVMTAGAVLLFKLLPNEFVPSQDQSRMMIRFQTAVGSSLDETDQLLKRAETFILNRPETERAYLVVGGFGGASVNGGMLFLTMKPPDQRKLTQQEFAQVLRKELNSYPGVRAFVQDLSQSGFTAQRGFPIEFSVRGSDWETLVQQAEVMKQKMLASGMVVDLDSDYQLGQPELRITPERQRASDLGISIENLATTINVMVGGVRAGKYNSNGRRLDIRVRLLASQRSSPEDVGRLKVRAPSGELLPLASLIKQEERPALQAITRRDRERAISFFANPAPGKSQNEALAMVEQLSTELKPGYRAVLGGASVAFRESFQGLLIALGLGILVAYMVLASQFNSFLHPVTVLTILPLSVAGATVALLVSGKSLNIFSMIGLLLLMGIVKKNSIMLVDYASHLREAGASAYEAMLKAGPVRLRPILMTSIATMMAAVPAALALGPGSELRQPMAVAVIGGLVVSTLLSLLVVPAFYLLADGAKSKLAGRTSRRAAAVGR
ncbi:MAG: efflux RND transporter permease subunit [Myxococcaceae bacterium]|nr:efflux RND transporter permease subunit [Myxococcaceae bacterium]